MDIKIREAMETDLSDILSLYKQLATDDDKCLTLDSTKTQFNKLKSYPYYKIFIAENSNETVGTFALLIMDNLAHSGSPSGILENVVVDREHQNKGIGKTMTNFAMSLCKNSGCYKLALSSNINRADAHAFYKSLKFEQHGISFKIDLKKELM